MGDKDDYLTAYRVFFENFAATVNPEDQLPVHIAGYTITEAELPGEVIYWTTQYLTEKQCPYTLMTPLRRIILEDVRAAAKKNPHEFGFKPGYEPEDSVYVALRLMQAVTARINDVCLGYLDNSRLDSLPPPPSPAHHEYPTASAAVKNSRRVMEDRHIEIGNLEALFGIETDEPTSFYAVYDGHAGSAAATYCAAHLHQYLVESPHFRTDLRRAMSDAFLRTDEEFVHKSQNERVHGGSTAVVVCVRAGRLLAAWVGDSLALLARRMRLMQLVTPHKPDREDERERIEASGGKVLQWGGWRVNGQLAVSRAIGDAQYKPYVTAMPQIRKVKLAGDEDFIVVASDGLWDFVSEDEVAVQVYSQLSKNQDDLKLVAKQLVEKARADYSVDNISVIVVFLKNPRDIVADNSLSMMDLGLETSAVNVNAPPFAAVADPSKAPGAMTVAGVACLGGDADNGVSDSDSEDLGPETAVDVDADADADVDDDADAEVRDLVQATAPTPPADAVEENHVDGNLVDNVADSGEESEDEWNYYKGEGEGDRQRNASEDADEPPRSETPCQDNSAWESSSVDMNSSPLNPDAPVFVPGTVAGGDVLLAGSPRKPLPMDDIELPDVAQFNTEAVVRPAELLDLDNCDQLNGHHNISMEGVTEHLNGNEKCEMESLGFGFNVGMDSDKIKDTQIIQDFERIQKDTTDFCNIQVLQTHTAYNPFAAEGDEELFERLKNKERDPMSMSFYQEKDDDTCERFGKTISGVDLNAVQPLPDSDDEDMQTNGESDNDKENVSPEEELDLLRSESNAQEPNNDIRMFDERPVLPSNANNINNFVDYNITDTNDVHSFSNAEFDCSNLTHETVAPTDTPESHKLLFEQIPEIPDGKSSELGFTNEDLQDPCESDKDTRVETPKEEVPQDFDMEIKLEETPTAETQTELDADIRSEHGNINLVDDEQILTFESVNTNLQNENGISEWSQSLGVDKTGSNEQIALSPEPEAKAVDIYDDEFSSNPVQENVVVDIHQNYEKFDTETHNTREDFTQENKTVFDTPKIQLENEHISADGSDIVTSKSPLPEDASAPQSPLPSESYMPQDSPLPSESPLPSQSPLQIKPMDLEPSPISSKSPIESVLDEPVESPASPVQPYSPVEDECHSHSPLPTEEDCSKPPIPAEVPLPRESPVSSDSPLPDDNSVNDELAPDEFQARASFSPVESSLPVVSPVPVESHVSVDSQLALESQSHIELPLPAESQLLVESPIPTESQLSATSPIPSETLLAVDPAVEESFAPSDPPRESALPEESKTEPSMPIKELRDSPSPVEELHEFNNLTEQQSDEVTPIEAASPTNFVIDSAVTTKSPVPEERHSPLPVETATELRPETASPRSSPLLEEATEAFEQTTTPVPAEDSHVQTEKATLEAPQVTVETAEPTDVPHHVPSEPEITTPAPDIVPDRPRADLVTDIDIGIPESRAQEICVPVTNEIQLDDAVLPGATPPPTPAVAPTDAASATAVPLAAAAAVGIAAAAAGAVKAKTPAKKSSTTPVAKTDARSSKSAIKSNAPAARTPTSAKRPAAPATPTSKTPTAKATPAKTPVAGSKPTTPATRPSPAAPARPSPKPAAPAAKALPRSAPAAAAKEAPAVARTAPVPRAAAPRPAPKAAAPKAPAATAKPAAPKPAPIKSTAARPATATATARATAAAPAATARTAPRPAAAARPAPAPAPAARPPPITRPKESKPKASEKTITNGDVKSAKPAPRPAAARPAAPRPAPRAPAPVASATTKSAAPKPATRAPLDKQSKDLANKRITAKAAPPRTNTTKAPTSARTAVTKPGAIKKPSAMNGLANGAGERDVPLKAPPSPPATDNALLPDVIA